MSEPQSESNHLRDRIIWHLQELDLPSGDASGDESERIADAVLDAMGLEQVGWHMVKENRESFLPLSMEQGAHEPVYRLTGADMQGGI